MAVKSLRGSSSRQRETLTDFLQEVTTMQSLDHPNIIRLYGVVLTQPLKMVSLMLEHGEWVLIRDDILCRELKDTITSFSFL